MKVLEISEVIQDVRDIISRQDGLIKKAGVFGSVARGNYNDNSDIDILIEYNAEADIQMEHFTEFCEVCNQIRDTLYSLYGRRIEIVHFEGDPARNLQDENVEKEVIWV